MCLRTKGISPELGRALSREKQPLMSPARVGSGVHELPAAAAARVGSGVMGHLGLLCLI